MSNFCGGFDSRSRSRNPLSGRNERQKNILPPVKPKSYQNTAGERDRDGRKSGRGRFNGYKSKSSSGFGPGAGVGDPSGCTGVGQETGQISLSTTDIKDLYPHQANTVSFRHNFKIHKLLCICQKLGETKLYYAYLLPQAMMFHAFESDTMPFSLQVGCGMQT